MKTLKSYSKISLKPLRANKKIKRSYFDLRKPERLQYFNDLNSPSSKKLTTYIKRERVFSEPSYRKKNLKISRMTIHNSVSDFKKAIETEKSALEVQSSRNFQKMKKEFFPRSESHFFPSKLTRNNKKVNKALENKLERDLAIMNRHFNKKLEFQYLTTQKSKNIKETEKNIKEAEIQSKFRPGASYKSLKLKIGRRGSKFSKHSPLLTNRSKKSLFINKKGNNLNKKLIERRGGKLSVIFPQNEIQKGMANEKEEKKLIPVVKNFITTLLELYKAKDHNILVFTNVMNKILNNEFPQYKEFRELLFDAKDEPNPLSFPSTLKMERLFLFLNKKKFKEKIFNFA